MPPRHDQWAAGYRKSGRELFKRKVRDFGAIFGVLDRHGAEVAIFIEVEKRILIEIAGLMHLDIAKLDVKRVGILEIFNLHGR